MRFTICATSALLLAAMESTHASSLLSQHDAELGLTESFLGDELLQLDADSDKSSNTNSALRFMGVNGKNDDLAEATREFTVHVAKQKELWDNKKKADYYGEVHPYCSDAKALE